VKDKGKLTVKIHGKGGTVPHADGKKKTPRVTSEQRTGAKAGIGEHAPRWNI